ncbi:ras-related protein ced-10-like [Macrobrachium rosenbergii]|uniref:ras-related protein ced-10-like n=1 Tax=Macrobrachium rosenbergii TaxID=79674 RepID=UPI0034D4A68A
MKLELCKVWNKHSVEKTIKIVVVGDAAVGKTSLVMSYTQNTFPTGYAPTIFDNFVANVLIDGEPYKVNLFDTAGHENFDRIRPLTYPDSDVVLICFSVNNMNSFQNVKNVWIPEVKKYCPNTPYVLVGTKTDLRKNGRYSEENLGFIKYLDGRRLSREVKAVAYFECSALTTEGLKNIFDEAILTSVTAEMTQGCGCTIL